MGGNVESCVFESGGYAETARVRGVRGEDLEFG